MVTLATGDGEHVVSLTLTKAELSTLIDCIDMQSDHMESARRNVTRETVLVSSFEQLLEVHDEYNNCIEALQKVREQLHDQYRRTD
jgi:hypothetical protein